MNIRGKIYNVLDLRILMKLTPLKKEREELLTMLMQREEDHKKWLGELIASTMEKRSFKLTTNPHACAFGKWYDNFSNKDRLLSIALKKFDTPHRKIHALGIKVEELKEN